MIVFSRSSGRPHLGLTDGLYDVKTYKQRLKVCRGQSPCPYPHSEFHKRNASKCKEKIKISIIISYTLANDLHYVCSLLFCLNHDSLELTVYTFSFNFLSLLFSYS